MNIILISTGDHQGAFEAAYRLHQNFKDCGHNSGLLVKQKTRFDQDIIQCPSIRVLRLAWNKAKMATVFRQPEYDPNYCFYNVSERGNYISTQLLLKQVPFKPDFIIVNWVSQFINARNIYELNMITGAPVLWYLVDMAPLTGGCHYAWDCEGYKKACGKCPALYSTDTKDISYRNFGEKLRYIQQANLTVVTSTNWLTKQAEQSALFAEKRIAQVMLGIDNDIFRPLDKSIGRTVFDLPMDKRIIFMGAMGFNQERKGATYMIEALKILSASLQHDVKEKLFLVIAGHGEGSILKDIPFPYKFVGLLNDDRILALAYQSADIFVCPSIEDSGPMMMNESIMCGTPVVAFNMGGALDLVHTGRTGYRARLKDSEDLARGIAGILDLDEDEYNKMTRNCSQLGLELCSPKVQVEGFERLFKDVANQARH